MLLYNPITEQVFYPLIISGFCVGCTYCSVNLYSVNLYSVNLCGINLCSVNLCSVNLYVHAFMVFLHLRIDP